MIERLGGNEPIEFDALLSTFEPFLREDVAPVSLSDNEFGISFGTHVLMCS